LELARPFLRNSGLKLEGIRESWLVAALEAVWTEVDNLSQIPDRVKFLFDEKWELESEAEALLAREESRKVIAGLREELRLVEEVKMENFRQVVSGLSKRAGVSGRSLYLPLRAALTGRTHGPELEKVFVLLGKEKILKRADSVLRRNGPERSLSRE
jgi:nondiscriminating glutamyl-tRNA synthetase